MKTPTKFLAYGDAPNEVGVLTADRLTVTVFTPTGDLSNVREAYFYETGANGSGRVGFWAYASGNPVDGFNPDVLPWSNGPLSLRATADVTGTRLPEGTRA